MKNSFRKLIPIAAAIGFTFAAAGAQAQTTFDLKDGSGNVVAASATSLDWNQQGSGVAKGVGPYGTPFQTGDSFEFLYQANLVAANTQITGLDTTSDGKADAGASFEYTIVAKLQEVVTGVAGAPNFQTAQFGVGGTNATNKVAIYYDTAMNANTATGTGFTDGTLIALLTIVSDGTESYFTSSGTSRGLGSASLHAEIVEDGDFINQNYLAGLTEMLFGVDFESNLNYPANSASTSAFHVGTDSTFTGYNVASNDIVFKVDGSSNFEGGAVPEPGTMMLLGMGMLGLVGASRRKSKKA